MDDKLTLDDWKELDIIYKKEREEKENRRKSIPSLPSLNDRIIEVIKKRPLLTVSEIAYFTKISILAVGPRLTKLTKEGKISRNKDSQSGVYCYWIPNKEGN